MDVPRQSSILLVDDDPDVGIAAQLLLQRRVAPVTCVRRPAEMLAAVDRLRPTLLLLDLNFGAGHIDGVQGLRLLEEVRARPHAPVVVVLTAYANIELAVRALKCGAFDFVVKPWNNVRLIATCQEAIRHSTRNEPGSPTSAATTSGAAELTATERTTREASAAAHDPTRTLAAQERAAVVTAMAEADGNLSAAARALGLSRAALYRRLEKYGL